MKTGALLALIPIASGVYFLWMKQAKSSYNLSHHCFNKVLTKTEAMQRQALINNIKYQLEVWLHQTHYSAKEKIEFNYTPHKANITPWLEFCGFKIKSFKINGSNTSLNLAEKFPLQLTKLKEGLNHVEIEYENHYRRDITGFHMF